MVRDSKEADLENPHVVHKYSSEFLSNLQKSMSVEDHQNCPPPYTVTGHTILKKQPIGSWTTPVENVPESSPTLFSKHASFRDEVEVMEYDRKEKIRRGILAKHKVRLHDSPVGSVEEEDIEGAETSGETREGVSKKRAAFADNLDSAASLDVPSECDDVFTLVTPQTESLKTSGPSEQGGEGSVCPHVAPSSLSDKPSDAKSQKEDQTQSDEVCGSLQKLSIHTSNLVHSSNTGSTDV